MLACFFVCCRLVDIYGGNNVIIIGKVIVLRFLSQEKFLLNPDVYFMHSHGFRSVWRINGKLVA